MAIAFKVKAKIQGFRRAGFKFSSTEETVLLLDQLSKAQVEALKAEPNLLVSEIEIEKEKSPKGDDKKAAGEGKASADDKKTAGGKTAGTKA
ncbi:MAG: HI1506-related protein [Alphaproteobacteria bacterium]|nr:HI1506-related protein [Alphaproteobacteria bacterium]